MSAKEKKNADRQIAHTPPHSHTPGPRSWFTIQVYPGLARSKESGPPGEGVRGGGWIVSLGCSNITPALTRNQEENRRCFPLGDT